MKSSELDLNDLRIFSRVASLKSFSLAADSLEINKSSASRAIKRLEEQFECQLLERTTRDIQLTPTGFQLKEKCTEILALVSSAVANVAPAGNVRHRKQINVGIDVELGPTFAAKIFANFILKHDFLDVCIIPISGHRVPRDLDLALLSGIPRGLPFKSKHLATIRRIIGATPEYLSRGTLPTSSADLMVHDIVAVQPINAVLSWIPLARFSQLDQFDGISRFCVNDC